MARELRSRGGIVRVDCGLRSLDEIARWDREAGSLDMKKAAEAAFIMGLSKSKCYLRS